MRYHFFIYLCLLSNLSIPIVYADTLQVKLTLPAIQTAQYEPPFVAIWLEKKGQRRAVETLSIWYNDKKWLKDIRRWWRKAGRYADNFDAVSSATRLPGKYEQKWQLQHTAGEYTLYLEAVREHGNRTVLKQKIQLGLPQTQHFTLTGGKEIGVVNITIQP